MLTPVFPNHNRRTIAVVTCADRPSRCRPRAVQPNPVCAKITGCLMKGCSGQCAAKRRLGLGKGDATVEQARLALVLALPAKPGSHPMKRQPLISRQKQGKSRRHRAARERHPPKRRRKDDPVKPCKPSRDRKPGADRTDPKAHLRAEALDFRAGRDGERHQIAKPERGHHDNHSIHDPDRRRQRIIGTERTRLADHEGRARKPGPETPAPRQSPHLGRGFRNDRVVHDLSHVVDTISVSFGFPER